MSNLVRSVGFVHLNVRSTYSLREGALKVETLVKLAAADSQPALALTDADNLFGALEFSEKAAKAGIQPIIGTTVTTDFGDAEATGAQVGIGSPRGGLGARGRIVLLARDALGYSNLMRIVSRAWLDPAPGDLAHVRLDRFGDLGGVVALTGGPAGPLDRALAAGRPELAASRLEALLGAFGENLHVEIQRHGLESERRVEPALLGLARGRGLAPVATNEPYFAAAADHEAHDALLCIADGALMGDAKRRRLTPEHRFKTRAAMRETFADLPEAADNSVALALGCAFKVATRKPILPRFVDPENPGADEAGTLRAHARAGLAERLAETGPAAGHAPEDYARRLEFELDVIAKMDFPGYFLIVADFIVHAKRAGIPVGPGRGSGAGSLVAYALKITDLDPLRFALLFERFLNPERVSMPDFDVDFCQTRRDEAIAYVRARYGADRVAQIITFGSFLARGVLRNVGRALEMPLGQVDRLAKLVPQNPAKPVTLKEAIAGEPRLREAAQEDPRVARMLRIAQSLEGLHSNASTHAAGLVIGDRPLEELVPLYRDPKSEIPATQFNMKWVEQAGLVKFDFLGLKTLTVIENAVRLLARRGVAVDPARLPLDDPETYEMLGRGETVGVFQVESGGMRRALVDMKADRFEDLIALVALYRPGPMANIPVYCARKLGREAPEYIHPDVEPVLRETFGVIVYQEQVMQIAQRLSGYSLGEADLLRRAMGKKIKAEMDAQSARFVEGCVERGIARDKAEEIFALLAKFADYGFNKSHAAAYALVCFQTAWLKAHHPVEFLAASMTLDKGDLEKLAEFRAEAGRLSIPVAPPDVGRSGVDFDVEERPGGGRAIVYALSAVKGVGEGQAAAIVAARGSAPFADLGDFARRVDARAVNKRAIEQLAAAGAFDAISPDRAAVHAAAESIVREANSAREAALGGQGGLFGAEAPATLAAPRRDGPAVAWSAAERLRREFDAVGFFLTGHPLDDHAAAIRRLKLGDFAAFARAVHRGETTGRLAATVLDRQERRIKSGSKMGVFTLSDPSGHYEAITFQEGLDQWRDLLEKGADVAVTLQGSADGEEVRARIVGVETLDKAAARAAKGLRVFLRDEAPLPSVRERLARRGEGAVSLVLMLGPAEGEIEVKLPGGYAIGAEIAASLRATAGVVAVEVA